MRMRRRLEWRRQNGRRIEARFVVLLNEVGYVLRGERDGNAQKLQNNAVFTSIFIQKSFPRNANVQIVENSDVARVPAIFVS